jgi:Zn-dependent metalloprotease
MKRFTQFSIAFIFLLCSFLQKLFSQENQLSQKQALALVSQNANALNLSTLDIQNSIVTNAYFNKSAGTKMIYLQQTYKRIPVLNRLQVIALKNDKVVSLSGTRILKIESKVNCKEGVPVVSPITAVVSAAKNIGFTVSKLSVAKSVINTTTSTTNTQEVEFGSLGISRENISSKLLWYPKGSGIVQLSWEVEIAPVNSPDQWLIYVDAVGGVVIGKTNLTVR